MATKKVTHASIPLKDLAFLMDQRAALERLVTVCAGAGWLRRKNDALAQAYTALNWIDPAFPTKE